MAKMAEDSDLGWSFEWVFASDLSCFENVCRCGRVFDFLEGAIF